MQNLNCKIIISFCIITGLILPFFSFGQEIPGQAAIPQTLEEAKDFMMAILVKLPEAVKTVWEKEALPVWKGMWEWIRPVIEPWRQKFLGLFRKEVEKRRPAIEEEIKKEKEEMQKDIWERFKALLD